MTLQKDDRDAIVAYRSEKANQALIEAAAIIELGFYNVVANRLYYAVFYACSALLIYSGVAPTTHAGVSRMVSLYFVKTGKLSLQDQSLLNKLFSMRQTGDYEDVLDWTEDDVKPLLTPTSKLVKKILGLIE